MPVQWGANDPRSRNPYTHVRSFVVSGSYQAHAFAVTRALWQRLRQPNQLEKMDYYVCISATWSRPRVQSGARHTGAPACAVTILRCSHTCTCCGALPRPACPQLQTFAYVVSVSATKYVDFEPSSASLVIFRILPVTFFLHGQTGG